MTEDFPIINKLRMYFSLRPNHLDVTYLDLPENIADFVWEKPELRRTFVDSNWCLKNILENET